MKSIPRATFQELIKYHASVERACSKLASKINEATSQIRTAKTEMPNIQNNINAIKSKLSKLRTMRRPKHGIMAGLFGITEIPPDIAAEIQSLQSQQSTLERQYSNHQLTLRRYSRNLPFLKKSFGTKRAFASQLETALELKRQKHEAELDRKKDVLQELRAAAASTSKQTRIVGSSVRRRLSKQSTCPYCGESLESTAHADHIYPVSKGGRSAPRNMVYVCSTCNGMKKDLTLTTFIRKYNLDRSAIEQRLEELGKEF